MPFPSPMSLAGDSVTAIALDDPMDMQPDTTGRLQSAGVSGDDALEAPMTSANRVYRTLAGQIISGTLSPGKRLEEKALAEQFNLSRTPIREALRDLSARGLIELVPRRGAVVAQISIERLADMLGAECEIEALCARLAALRMTALEKGELQHVHERATQCVADGDYPAYLQINQELHELICRGAHNETIGTMMRELRSRLGPFRQAPFAGVEERLARSHTEHDALVAAIVRGEPEAAYETMRTHNARLSTSVLRLLKQRETTVTSKDPGSPV